MTELSGWPTCLTVSLAEENHNVWPRPERSVVRRARCHPGQTQRDMNLLPAGYFSF